MSAMSATPLRVSLRLKPAVAAAVDRAAAEVGLAPTVFMQKAIETAVRHELPAAERERSEREQRVLRRAQEMAVEVYRAQGFDAHFTLRVIRALMRDAAFRDLYESVIEADAYDDKAPLKTPLNMYLGWTIKNAVPATPLLDDKGAPKRAVVKGEPIKSYTLLAHKP
ncbi:MAG: hypothetical protein HZY79_03285 [Rhodoblastus sp.]|nr:MAG: hypothetical protein HZY79_03285 [Rhodoblastus sp.]